LDLLLNDFPKIPPPTCRLRNVIQPTATDAQKKGASPRVSTPTRALCPATNSFQKPRIFQPASCATLPTAGCRIA
jgi:hypothetical protein